MIKLVVGNKGSGKTKKLIEMVNTAVKNSKGNVVCVEKGSVMTFDINHDARLIDIDDYDVFGYDSLYGFITGLLAGNYDITDLFVDATLRIGGRDYEALTKMLKKLDNVTKQTNTYLTLTISCAKTDLPEYSQNLAVAI